MPGGPPISFEADPLMVMLLRGRMRDTALDAYCVATDGGCEGAVEMRVAGYGICVGKSLSYNASVGGLDTSPGFAEFWAVFQLLNAADVLA